MSLTTHVRKGDWTHLEDEWTELMLGDASIQPVLDALPFAAKRRELPRLVPMVREHADILQGAERATEAAELLGTAMLEGGSPGELGKQLFDCAQAAWGEQPWWESFCELAGLVENAPDMRQAWRAFQKLVALKDGLAVYHAKGWGIGKVDGVDLTALEVRVRFASGRADAFPMQTAVDIFTVLKPDDPRSMVVLDPDGLKRMIKQEPLDLLRAVVRRHGGQVTHAQLKITMGLLGVDGPGFTAFWRRARKLADASSWFEITGSGTKVQVRLLDTEADPAESLKRQLQRSTSLGAALTRVRELFVGGNLDQTLRDTALSTLDELAARDGEALPRRLAVWMFLREERGGTPDAFAELLRAAAAAPPPAEHNVAPELWKLFALLPGLREQERCIELLREVTGEAWLDQAASNLVHAAPGMVRGLVEALDEAGRRDVLVATYAALLLRPNRNPNVLVALAARLETDGGPIEGLPPAVQRVNSLLQLATHLKRQPASDAAAARARTRLTALLVEGDPPFLRRMLASATHDELRRLNPLVDRGVDREIDRVFTAHIVEVAPEIFRGSERPFWEGDGIWTTRAGLAKREEELRILTEVKIPENSEAIGKAASYGDLSENSEWEAAIEEQRNLTSRAAGIEAEVRSAELIENAAIPEETVCPGTRVRYRTGGEEHEARVLGPWDAEEEDVISYRSPLAEGMLGKHPGDRLTVDLPGGKVEVEVIAVEAIHF